MSRRNFATVAAVLVVICIVIFAGGVLAQSHSSGPVAPPAPVSSSGDRPRSAAACRSAGPTSWSSPPRSWPSPRSRAPPSDVA